MLLDIIIFVSSTRRYVIVIIANLRLYPLVHTIIRALTLFIISVIIVLSNILPCQ